MLFRSFMSRIAMNHLLMLQRINSFMIFLILSPLYSSASPSYNRYMPDSTPNAAMSFGDVKQDSFPMPSIPASVSRLATNCEQNIQRGLSSYPEHNEPVPDSCTLSLSDASSVLTVCPEELCNLFLTGKRSLQG